MPQEIEFMKYKNRGAYHWDQISSHLLKGNAFVKARYQKCIDLLKKGLTQLHHKKILDYGCGDGVFTFMLWQNEANAYGVDVSDIAINLARKEHYKRGIKSYFDSITGYKTPFDDNYFDAVVCSDVIEHVQKPSLLLQEIYRILKKDGYAVISTPIRLTETPDDKMHVVEWFENEFAEMINKVFSDVQFSVSHPLWWFELITLHKIFRLIINGISILSNPFLSETGWRFFTMQYALVKK
jgi:2-polyprenyl-3-methyl-5-hydroxy-6-metoxy-1,4-benzoquinol methylase